VRGIGPKTVERLRDRAFVRPGMGPTMDTAAAVP